MKSFTENVANGQGEPFPMCPEEKPDLLTWSSGCLHNIAIGAVT